MARSLSLATLWMTGWCVLLSVALVRERAVVEMGQEGGRRPQLPHPNQRFLATTLPPGLFWELELFIE